MATLDQKKFASIVRMLQAAYPNTWEKHLQNLGVPPSANPPAAELDRIKERVFWMVPQAGIKNPATWMVSDMARAEAASASVEPEIQPKVALDDAIRQSPAGLEPVMLRTDRAKTFGESQLAPQRGIQNPAVSIATDMARLAAPLASVEPETRRRTAPPVAVRQNPVEPEPVKRGMDQAKTSSASPVASETRIKNSGAGIATDVVRVTAPLAAFEPKAQTKVARPVAVRQNPVEPKSVKLRTDRATMFDISLLELEAASEIAAQELNWAKLRIEARKPREAADYMYNAHDLYYATQQEIAAAVGKSQGWVSCMIRWCRERFKDETPFGPASKQARERARMSRLIGRRLPRQSKLRRRW
jgi:hypothetical protein